MLALTNDHGDHSFLLINSDNINSGHTSRLLVERAFFNDPKERCGSHPFFVWRLAFGVRARARKAGVWAAVRSFAPPRIAPRGRGIELLLKNEGLVSGELAAKPHCRN
jgi:hypothetical protein